MVHPDVVPVALRHQQVQGLQGKGAQGAAVEHHTGVEEAGRHHSIPVCEEPSVHMWRAAFLLRLPHSMNGAGKALFYLVGGDMQFPRYALDRLARGENVTPALGCYVLA